MSADTLLNLAGATLGLTYILLIAAYLAVALWTGVAATLRHLTWTVRITRAAVVVAVTNIVVHPLGGERDAGR